MEKGLLHLHVTVVSIFILLYATKAFLLLANKPEALAQLRSKAKVADMILGSLVILTGLFLIFTVPAIETYLLVKLILVFASIPMALIAMKTANKPLTVAVVLIHIYVFAVAKTDSLTLKKEAFITPISLPRTSGNEVSEGKIIYDTKCASCHGMHGKRQLNGAKDLSLSTLTRDETIEMIKSGKGLMPDFKDEFNEQQLKTLADYIEGLRK